MDYELEPDRTARSTLADEALEFINDFVDRLLDAPASNATSSSSSALAAPPCEPQPLQTLLGTLSDAASDAVETAGPGYLAYFPSGGLYSSVLGEAIAQVLNRYTGVAAMAPGMIALEESVLRWFCHEFGLPASSGGLITSGASIATLAALHAARQRKLNGPDDHAVIYVTEHTHLCVAKAARIAGFTDAQVRMLPIDHEHRMDVAAASEAIRIDRAAGRRPFLIVATAGSTSTGTVDPIADIAEVASTEGLWLHVDGAYGGGFQLTERGRGLLARIEYADSITFDPHKSMFLPYGTGVLLVRDASALRAAHSADGDYLQDLADDPELPDYADLGPELTRDSRGLRLWLPLHLHGTEAFRRALDEKLDLAHWAYDQLRDVPHLELPLRPDLTVLVARSAAGDDATREMLRRINAGRRVFMSSTRLDGRFTLRLCVLSHRTHRDRVAEAVAAVREAAQAVA